jgi:hypothetical protein
MARSTRRRNNTRKRKGNLGGNRTSLKTFRNGSSAPSKSASRHINFRGNSRRQAATEQRELEDIKKISQSFSSKNFPKKKPPFRPLGLGLGVGMPGS